MNASVMNEFVKPNNVNVTILCKILKYHKFSLPILPKIVKSKNICRNEANKININLSILPAMMKKIPEKKNSTL